MTDAECWKFYSKHNWVYNRIDLFDSQDVLWSPWKHDYFDTPLNIFTFDEFPTQIQEPGEGKIYVHLTSTKRTFVETFIHKTDIKIKRYYEDDDFKEVKEIDGVLLLRNDALLTSKFSNFKGVIIVEFLGNFITSVKLRSPLEHKDNDDIQKVIDKIYKK